MNRHLLLTLYHLSIIFLGVGITSCIEQLSGEANYTVTFNPNGGTFEDGTEGLTQEDDGTKVLEKIIKRSERAEAPKNLKAPATSSGNGDLSFGGWYTDNSLEDQFLFDFSTPITEDIELYAKWGYRVTFNAGEDGAFKDGTKVLEQIVAKNTQVNIDTLVDLAPSDRNFKLGGWYTDNSLKDQFLFDFGTPITKNITLYANWIPITYTVTFNANGGTFKDSEGNDVQSTSKIVAKGNTVQSPTNLKREGYTFRGWYEDEVLTGESNQFSFGPTGNTITENITLYAQWGCLVTFNANDGTFKDGTKVLEQIVAENSKVQEPDSAPTRRGYTFGGWYTDNSPEDQFLFDFGTPITKNITLYAKWTEITYTVTFNANGGTFKDSEGNDVQSTSKIVAKDQQITAPATTHRCYATVSGWYTDEATTEFNFENETITGDITLYAQWDITTPKEAEAKDPILICSWKQLQWIAQDPSRLDKNYKLENDITFPTPTAAAGEDGFPTKGFVPIGHDVVGGPGEYAGTAFSGTFDGNYKTISNFFINAMHNEWTTETNGRIADNDFIGLFGQINRTASDPAVKNLTIVLASGTQDSPSINADTYVGGLAGQIIYAGGRGMAIENVVVKGGHIKGRRYVGGFAGVITHTAGNNEQKNFTPLSTGYTTSNITAAGSFVGGFAGKMTQSAANGYATGNINFTTDTTAISRIGGFAGQMANSSATGYATGNINFNATITSVSYIGGFAGQMDNSSATGYATGNISSTNANATFSSVGGFAGEMASSSVIGYAVGKIPISSSGTIGGFVGEQTSGEVSGEDKGTTLAYWDVANSGQKTPSTTKTIGISATQNIVFDGNGEYTDSQGTPDNTDDDVSIFNFTFGFDVTNGANATWPKLKTGVFSLPQPTISDTDQNRTIEVVFQ